MSLTHCNVHFTGQSEKVVYISTNLMKSLNLAGGRQIHLRLGRGRIPAAVRTIRKPGKHLYLANGIRNAINIPKAGTVYLRNTQNGVVQLGPLIGVLSDGPGSTSQPFGSRTGFIRQLLREGNKRAYIFAFAPRDIDWNKETVNGYFLSDKGEFTRKRVPLPDVVYNRLPSRRFDFSPSTNMLRERFSRKKIPFFNWSFFNKSDIYRLLENMPSVSKYIPESYMNPTRDQIAQVLERHQMAYYKPSAGSLGKGIYKLSYTPQKGYYLRYRRGGSNALLRFSSFDKLMRMLQARLGQSMRGYVVQQGIHLIELDECPIDFRFHMHKNGSNQWVAVGIGAKKAGKGSVTTHIKNGGSLLTPERALSRSFGSRSGEVLQNMKRIAVILAQAIESQHKHLLGEIGFDLGIDRNEQVWMFEANAKPGRSIFHHPSLRSEGKASIDHILDHCLYLSKFNGREDA